MLKERGFTLLEMMLAIGTIAILGGLAVGYYAGVFRSISLDAAQKIMVSDLRRAQAQAMYNVDSMKWGIHFVNSTTHYYEIFKTPTNYASMARVTTETINLPSGVLFSDPVASTTKDVIFERTTGLTAASSVGLVEASTGTSATIGISALGVIE